MPPKPQIQKKARPKNAAPFGQQTAPGRIFFQNRPGAPNQPQQPPKFTGPRGHHPRPVRTTSPRHQAPPRQRMPAQPRRPKEPTGFPRYSPRSPPPSSFENIPASNTNAHFSQQSEHPTTFTRQIPTEPVVADKGRIPFPQCAQQSLMEVRRFVEGQIDQKFRRSRYNELQDFLDLHLFSAPLTSTQHNDLLSVICAYFMEITKNAKAKHYEHFHTLFCGREGDATLHAPRMELLSHVARAAVRHGTVPILGDIAAWSMKISSNIYAIKIIAQVVRDFVRSTPEEAFYHNLTAMSVKAPEFAAIFAVYSTNGDQMCSHLADILGEWLTVEGTKVLPLIAANPTLKGHFTEKSIEAMCRYDVLNAMADEPHERFHCMILMLLVNWVKTCQHNRPPLGTASTASTKISIPMEFLNELCTDTEVLEEHQRRHYDELIELATICDHPMGTKAKRAKVQTQF